MNTNNSNKNKLVSPTQVAWASLSGGPAAGFWFIAKNFEAFNKEKKRKDALFFSLLSFVLLLLSLPLNIPFAIYPIYTILMRIIMDKWQGKEYKRKLAAGCDKISTWYVTGISIIFFLSTMAAMFLFYFGIKYFFGWKMF